MLPLLLSLINRTCHSDFNAVTVQVVCNNFTIKQIRKNVTYKTGKGVQSVKGVSGPTLLLKCGESHIPDLVLCTE